MRNFSLSRLQSAFKFSYVVQKFKSMYSKSTAVSILLESKVNRPIRKKVRPGQKIYCNMEKRLICSLTIIKLPTTLRAAAGKERVGATIVRRMLNGLAIRTFRKAKRFLIAKQKDARRKIWCRRFRRRFWNADLKHMIWMDGSYVVVSEYFNDQSKRYYGQRFDLTSDFKRYRLAPAVNSARGGFCGHVALTLWFCPLDLSLRLLRTTKAA